MTVPGLDTSFIGTYAYIQPATEVQIADVLPYLLKYQQYHEYIDGVMRVYDTGNSGPYIDVYVRIRTDGWMMAFFPDDAHVGTACWGDYDWTINYENRGHLVWWGHAHTTVGNPPEGSTTLGKALSLVWDRLKANSDNPTYNFAWTDVGYYDYECTSSLKLYIFGAHTYAYGSGFVQVTVSQTYTFVVPVGTTVQRAFANGSYNLFGRGDINVSFKSYGRFSIGEHYFFNLGTYGSSSSGKFLTYNASPYVLTEGQKNSCNSYSSACRNSGYSYVNTGFVILASG